MSFPIPIKQRSISLLSPLHPLTNKNFGIFWSGAFLSSIGFWIQTVGQGWQVLQLTNSAFLLGVVTFAATLPNIVLSLLGGVISDRMNRRHLLIITQTVYMTTAALLGILTTLHIITVWQIILFALVNGIFSSVGFPAWQTFIGDLVPPKELRQGIALNSMQFNLSRVVGPAIGGISVGLVGIAGSYYLNALSYVAVLIPLFWMHAAQKQSTGEKQSVWRSVQEGLQYTRHHPVLIMALLLQFTIAFLIFPYMTLLPVFAGNIFHIGATGLGVMNAAAGIGALVGSLTVVFLSQRLGGERSLRLLMLLCIIGGCASLGFAFAPTLTLALPLLIILGTCTVMSMTITNTTLQSGTPDMIRGRVLSLWVLITFGLAPFGNLVAGWIAQLFGASMTLAVGGCACAVVALLIVLIRMQMHRHAQVA